VQVNGNPVPDGNEEYLIYQTLLGTFPVEQINDEELALYTDKIQKYILKALREAKVHSGWISADTEYEQGVMDFIAAILEPSDNSFLTDFVELNRVAATCGMYNSLSQVVLKIFSPGTPDIYQGNELWTFSLTDPDNRQPVDFTQRTRLLNHLQKRVAASRNLAGLAQMLMQESTNGQIKLYVTWRSLNYRRDNAALFDEGSYIPLKAAGARKEHICAFAFKRGRREIIVAVPRLVAALTHNAEARPLDVEIWGDTDLILPRKLSGKSFRNIFTNETVIVRHREDSAGLLLADVFKVFPVAALESVPH
jgi:(1->4)-alpha-D-glucan 1-alpha-D-glucosylmutase